LMNHYQPIVSANDGSVVGFEALVRWQHPERGLVSPAEFIPVAEQTGLIVPIGDLVLRQACFEAVRWQEVRGPGKQPLRVSVNLSPRQLAEPDVVETVERALADSGLDPALLSLEITETMLLTDTTAAMETLARVKALGVRLDLDDFGTGYSSLTYVRQFPIGALKIDRSFVAGLGESVEHAAIVTD